MESKYKAGDIVFVLKHTAIYKFSLIKESEIRYASSLEPLFQLENVTPAIYFEEAEGYPLFSKVIIDNICYAVHNNCIIEGDKYVG